jgi:Ankyrin repeats (3 copies)
MPRRRGNRAAQTSLVQHRTPDLARLLNEAESCEVAAVRRFLSAGGLPDALIPVGAAGTSDPMIFAAISKHHFERSKGSMDLLLDAGANMNALDANLDSTPLIFASALLCCDEPLVTLLQRDADSDLRTPTGKTALQMAAKRGQVSKCRLLLAAGASIELGNLEGRPPLLQQLGEGISRWSEYCTESMGLTFTQLMTMA